MIREANAGPIPGRRCKSPESPVFRLTGPSGYECDAEEHHDSALLRRQSESHVNPGTASETARWTVIGGVPRIVERGSSGVPNGTRPSRRRGVGSVGAEAGGKALTSGGGLRNWTLRVRHWDFMSKRSRAFSSFLGLPFTNNGGCPASRSPQAARCPPVQDLLRSIAPACQRECARVGSRSQ
jgi:hypothetical protein